MSIQIEQPGASTAAAQAGTMIGKAERAKEDRATAERASAQASSQAAEVQARQTAMDWELQKMILNSQQDFSHEMRLRQADLDGEARAKEWEVEKMEMRSKMDFEQEERERVRENTEAVAGEKTLLESPMSDEERARGLFNLWRIHPNVPALQKYSGREPQTERIQTMSQKRNEMEAIVGGLPGESLDELVQRVAEAGYNPDTLKPLGVSPGVSSEGITATNPTTGEKVVSYDNGATWQPLDSPQTTEKGSAFSGRGVGGEW